MKRTLPTIVAAAFIIRGFAGHAEPATLPGDQPDLGAEWAHVASTDGYSMYSIGSNTRLRSFTANAWITNPALLPVVRTDWS